jgi:hypothetical protein
LYGEVGESLDGHASAGLERYRLIITDSVVEPHEADYLTAMREEEEPKSLVHCLGEAVIGEGVKVGAFWEEVYEGNLSFLHISEGIISVVMKHLVGVNPIILVLKRILIPVNKFIML